MDALLSMENEKKHALLGASSSHRWLNCTPSAMAESTYPDKGSEFAEEGTLAHAMGARLLKSRLHMDTSDEEAEISDLAARYHTTEMDEHVESYADYVGERYRTSCEIAGRRGKLMPEIRIEQRLDFSDYVPEGFGTGDTVIVCEGTVEIIDLKYGKGVEVSAKQNTQMMLYALGAMDLFDYAYGIDSIVMTIFQPRLANISTWCMTAGELRRWAEEELRPLARLASKGKGVRNSGEWCRFCKAKGECVAIARESLDIWALNKHHDIIPKESFAILLDTLPTIRGWADAVEERAAALLLGGEKLPGLKLVEGKSTRKISDTEGAVNVLSQAGYPESEIFKPRELRGIGDLEKLIGKKAFTDLCGGFVTKPKGKPTVVSEEDKRRPWNPGDEFEI